jgi:uncharacterized membrane protein (UPF0127 family)
MRNAFGLIALALCLAAGCQKSGGGDRFPTGAEVHLTNAQPRLPTIKLWIGSAELITEVASQPVQMATGMMFRKAMAENEAMIFVFPQPQRASFYMKNTTVPLSIGYLDTEGVLREIHDLKPLELNPVVSAAEDIRFALEVPQGWFQRHQITPGMVARTERGPLAATLLGRR